MMTLVIEPSTHVTNMYVWWVKEDDNTEWYKARHYGLTFTILGARWAAYRKIHKRPKHRHLEIPITKKFEYPRA